MSDEVLRFRNLPYDARNYIKMHTLSSPLMVAEYAFIAYLLYSHYIIIEIGIFYTIANIVTAAGPYIVGRTTRLNISARKTMSLIFLTEGVGYFVFFLASGSYSSLILLAGLIIFKFSSIFYSIFPSYEQIVFPEKIREKSYLFHLIYPEYTQIVAFPAIGFILSYIFPWAISYRILFLGISVASFLMLFFINSRIRKMEGPLFAIDQKRGKVKLPRPFFSIFLSQTAFYAAQAIIPNIIMVYYVLIILKQTFFVVMLLEALNSIVTIFLGSALKVKRVNSRAWVAGGISLFVMQQVMFVSAGLILNIIPVAIGIIFGTAGNVLWLPVSRSALMKAIPEDARGEVLRVVSSTSPGISLFIPVVSAYIISIYVYSPFILSACLFAASLIGYMRITKGPGNDKTIIGHAA